MYSSDLDLTTKALMREHALHDPQTMTSWEAHDRRESRSVRRALNWLERRLRRGA